jgi:LuxR family maltose regulon positive regulatory protein
LAGQIDQARDLLVQGLGEAPAGSHERVSALSTLSLLEAWCGKVKRAETLICEALLSAREAGMLADRSVTDAYLAAVMTSLRRGDAGTPAGTEPLRLPAASFPQDQEEAESLSTMLFERAVSSLTLGDPERARGIVGSWPELVPDPDPLAVVQCHILLSWVARGDNEPDEALRQLGEAVKMAEIHGLVGVFVRAGPVILRRLRDISGPQAAFRDIILAHAQQSIGPRQQALREPLTDRELEILSYLPTRFTNVELADRCFVSVNTIKTHMVHIYRKLDATNRDAAIGRARILGLL